MRISVKVCPECKALFKPRSKKEKYCSDKCHIAAIYKRIEKEKIEAFFRSDWGEMLTGLDGEFCIKRIKENTTKG